MGTTEAATGEGTGCRDGGRAAPFPRGQQWAPDAPAGLWARHFWAWPTGTGHTTPAVRLGRAPSPVNEPPRNGRDRTRLPS